MFTDKDSSAVNSNFSALMMNFGLMLTALFLEQQWIWPQLDFIIFTIYQYLQEDMGVSYTIQMLLPLKGYHKSLFTKVDIGLFQAYNG